MTAEEKAIGRNAIHDLRDDAVACGDPDLLELCERALAGETAAMMAALTYHIVRDRVRRLRDEARAAGDWAQAGMCERALSGCPIALAGCIRVFLFAEREARG